MSTPAVQESAARLLMDTLHMPAEPRQSNEWNRLVIAAAGAVINRRKNRLSPGEKKKLVDEFAAYLAHAGHGIVHSHTLEQRKPGNLADAGIYHGPAEAIAEEFIANVDKSLRFSQAPTGAHSK